jgi:hypothetical protein
MMRWTALVMIACLALRWRNVNASSSEEWPRIIHKLQAQGPQVGAFHIDDESLPITSVSVDHTTCRKDQQRPVVACTNV